MRGVMVRSRRRAGRGVAVVAAVGLLSVGCTGGGGADDDGADGAAVEDGTDVDGADGGDGDGDEADGGPEVELRSFVVVEPIDAPRSATEIRVGEIIVEFDGRVTDDGTVLTLEEPILFDFDSATLRSRSRAALDDIAEVLAFYAGAPVEVVGHTDDVGSRDYNLDLSARRAVAVLEGLVSRGIEPDRLSSDGRAFDEPVASNDTDAGRAQNRRVEVLIVGVLPPDANDG